MKTLTVPIPPELRGAYPLVLFFGSRADADEFTKLVQQAKPGMVTRALDPLPPEDEREPDGFCVWCSKPYYEGDGVPHRLTREVFCTKACIEEHDANL